MNNTEYKIAQSEAEWLRYRYDDIGIRESIRLFKRAIKRGIDKRVRRVIVTVCRGVKKEVFTPSYDASKENIVVSLTSIPERLRTIFPTLYSLASQSHKPDLIVLWLSDDTDRTARIIARIEGMGITVKYCKDLGPNTKYHYAFDEYKKDVVITVDDDIIYHNDMIEELYGTYLKHPDTVIARRVHKIRFDHDGKPASYRDWTWEYRDSAGPSYDLLATGVGGVLYPPSVMALNCWENTDFLKISPKSDDIWLKFCELSCGIRVCAVNGSAFDRDVINFRTFNTGLSLDNINRDKNDEYVRSCAEYFRMSDDLCKKILDPGIL